MIAFIVRVHEAAGHLAGVVEFPGSDRTPFRSGEELIRLMESWIDGSAGERQPPQLSGGS